MSIGLTRRSFTAGVATVVFGNNALADCAACGEVVTPPGRNVVIDYAPRDIFDIPNSMGACRPVASGATSPNFKAIAADGIEGVIRRATSAGGWSALERASFGSEREKAKKAGLLWGSYHFGRWQLPYYSEDDAQEVPGDLQADVYLSEVDPPSEDLICLDFETYNPIINTSALDPGSKSKEASPEKLMRVQQVIAFIERIKEKTGRYPILNTRTALIQQQTLRDRQVLLKCKLWLSEYIKQNTTSRTEWARGPLLPEHIPTWQGNVLWQWAPDVVSEGNCYEGITRKGVAGIRKCDRSTFDGDLSTLRRFWTK